MDSITMAISIITICGSVVAIILFYGNFDKRLTIIETEQKNNVTGKELLEKLKEWKNEILHEVSKIKNGA